MPLMPPYRRMYHLYYISVLSCAVVCDGVEVCVDNSHKHNEQIEKY